MSSDSSESFDINYIVKAGNKISETQELEIVRDASSQTVMDIVQNSLMYSGYEDITIEIVSARPLFCDGNAGEGGGRVRRSHRPRGLP